MFKKLFLMIYLCCGVSLSVNLDNPNRDSLIRCIFGTEFKQEAWQNKIEEVAQVVAKAELDGTRHRQFLTESDSPDSFEYYTAYQQAMQNYHIKLFEGDKLIATIPFKDLPKFLEEYSRDLPASAFGPRRFNRISIHNQIIDYYRRMKEAVASLSDLEYALSGASKAICDELIAQSEITFITGPIKTLESQMLQLRYNLNLRGQMKLGLYFICTLNLRCMEELLDHIPYKEYALIINCILYLSNTTMNQVVDGFYANWHVYGLLSVYYYAAIKIMGRGLFNQIF